MIEVSTKTKGGLFTKDVERIVQKQIQHELLGKIQERFDRPRQGKGLGARRNITNTSRSRLELTFSSTRIWPRTRGTAWKKKNTAIVKSMAPRIVKKTAARIVEELT